MFCIKLAHKTIYGNDNGNKKKKSFNLNFKFLSQMIP